MKNWSLFIDIFMSSGIFRVYLVFESGIGSKEGIVNIGKLLKDLLGYLKLLVVSSKIKEV